MQFYEPGAFEELVAKLSAIRLKPSSSVWQAISEHLDGKQAERKRILFQRTAFAAGFVILLGLSFLSIFLVKVDLQTNNPAFAQLENSLFDESSQINSSYSYINQTITAKSNNYFKIWQSLTPDDFQNGEQAALPQVEETPIVQKNFSELRPNFIYPYKIKPEQLIQKTVNQLFVFSNDPFEKVAASKSNAKIDKSDWEIAGFINPTYAYHTTAALNRKLNPNETGVWMWGADILIRKRLNSYFSIYSGLQINPMGQTSKNLVLLRSNNNNRDMEVLSANTSFGFVSLENRKVAISNFSNLSSTPTSVLRSSSLNSAQLSQLFHYIEAPLIASTSLKKKNIEIEIKLGCSIGMLISNRFEVVSSGGTFYGETEDVRPYNANVLGSVSLSAPLYHNLSFIIEPSVKLSLSPISYSFVATHPFSTSVKFGLGYRF
jgi:hypothetical protein